MRYREQIIEVTRESFQKWWNPLHKKIVERENVVQDMWIFQAPFYSMLYINDGRYLPGDEAPKVEHARPMQKSNAIKHDLPIVHLIFSLTAFWVS